MTIKVLGSRLNVQKTGLIINNKTMKKTKKLSVLFSIVSALILTAPALVLAAGGPTAVFTAIPSPASCGQNVSFNASGSISGDFPITNYTWQFGDGETGTGITTSHSYNHFGTYTAILTVTDNNSPPLSSTASKGIAVNQGNHAPVANAGGPYTVNLGDGLTLNGGGSYDPDASCGDRIASFKWFVDNILMISGATPTLSLSVSQIHSLTIGSHSLKLEVVDAFGASGSNTTTLNVLDIDTTPPVIAAHNDVIAEATSPSGAIVSYVLPTATDDRDASVTVNCAPVSGTNFPFGDTTVTCNAKDSSNNSAIPTTFKITVQDKTVPTIKCPGDIEGKIGQPISLGLPEVSDIVDLNPTVTNDAPVSFSLGLNTVKWTAKDYSGNSSNCTQKVTLTYQFGNILQPINEDGSSVFKLGRTVPVKFQLQDYNGVFINNAVASIKVAKIDNSTTGTDIEAVSTAAATAGNLFRYDMTSNQYIFNLATKPLAVGTWQIKIILDDGTSPTVNISLK